MLKLLISKILKLDFKKNTQNLEHVLGGDSKLNTLLL